MEAQVFIVCSSSHWRAQVFTSVVQVFTTMLKSSLVSSNLHYHARVFTTMPRSSLLCSRLVMALTFLVGEDYYIQHMSLGTFIRLAAQNSITDCFSTI